MPITNTIRIADVEARKLSAKKYAAKIHGLEGYSQLVHPVRRPSKPGWHSIPGGQQRMKFIHQ